MRVEHHRRCGPSGRLIARNLRDLDTNLVLNWGKGREMSETDTSLIINNPERVRIAGQKDQALQIMRDAGVPCPEHIDDPIAAVGRGEVIVGRTQNHRSGSGFFLCRTATDVQNARTNGAHHFMAFVEAVHEYRVHVFNKKVIKTSEKVGGTGVVRSHRNGWTFASPTQSFEDRRRSRKAALKAVKALGLHFGAVDVLQDSRGNVFVLEVNTAPSQTCTTSSTLENYLTAIRRFVEENPTQVPTIEHHNYTPPVQHTAPQAPPEPPVEQPATPPAPQFSETEEARRRRLAEEILSDPDMCRRLGITN